MKIFEKREIIRGRKTNTIKVGERKKKRAHLEIVWVR